MSAFSAGALQFKIQTIGAQVFRQDQADAKAAIEKTGTAAQSAKGKVDGLGTATDEAGKKAKAAKGPLDEQAKSTEEVGKKSKKASEEQTKQKATTEQQIAAAKELSAAMLVAGTAIGALVGLAVAKSTEFGAAMSNVRAATMATADEQRALGEAALEAGADTAYSAREAAAAEEELAKAGLTVSEIVGGSLNGALALAAAGQLEVARSAEIMATTLTQFGLKAESSAHVADVLAAGAGKAQGSVDDLALALQYVGPLAAQAGWSLDETAGTLSYFATQGILGEKAGTSLRGVLAALQSPSSIAAKTMEKYGLTIYDANGNMLTAAQVAGNMQKAFGSLTQEERNAAMGRIFGNESLLAATLLYQGGAEKISEWTDNVNDASYAADQAAMRQDNLAGDVEKLGGAFDTALIKTGSGANDVLRSMVQSLTALVDMYGEAPAPIQTTALVIGVAAAAMLLFAGGAVGARAKFIELKGALDTANVSMNRTALLGGAAGLALTGVITVVGLLMAAQAEARQKAESYADAIEQGADAARSLAADNLVAEKSFLWINRGSAADAAEKLGLSLNTVADAATGNADALEKVNAAIQKGLDENWKPAKDANFELAEAASVLQESLNAETEAYANGTKQAQQKNEVTEEGAEVSQTAAEAYMAEAESVEDLNSQLQDLIDQINEINGINQDAVSANAEYQESIAAIAEQADKMGVSLKESTVAGSANAEMLSGVAQSAQDAAAAQFEVDLQTMSAKDASDKYYSTLVSQREAFINSAVAAGFNADEVKALADRVFQLPSKKDVKVIAETASAQIAIDSYISRNTGREIIVKIGTSRVGQGLGGSGGITQADGGIVNFADGGIRPPVSFFANGGRSEHHVAQIARAGEWRVWAEDETGGEAYIPFAPSKRARSEAVMAETAARLGGTYIPAGASRFASGSAVTAPGSLGLRDGDQFVFVIEGTPLTATARRVATQVVAGAFPSAAAITSQFAR